jgi:membrane-bound lytic murein transglycosylase MltF
MEIKNITHFDTNIKRFHTLFDLPYDWRLLKAQLYQESKLDPHAISPVGACGLAQFMPGTWREYLQKCHYPPGIKPTDPYVSVHLCAWYMQDLLSKWVAPRPLEDKYSLALASYNAGMGNILKAQRFSGNASLYNEIIVHLNGVTGNDNASETKNYVRKIWMYYEILKGEQ